MMYESHKKHLTVRAAFYSLAKIACVLITMGVGLCFAHPLGNFTINHYSGIAIATDAIRVRYVIDMAEIPAFQELQQMATGDSGGSITTSPSTAQLEAYAQSMASRYSDGLLLTLDGARVSLKPVGAKITLPAGAGGLPTLRLECDYAMAFAGTTLASGVHRLTYSDANYAERIGWREIVVNPASGISVFDSSAFGSSVTDELRNYPREMIAAPLNERSAELSFKAGTIAANAAGALLRRDGHPLETSPDRLTGLIVAPEVTLRVALLSLLIAAGLGAAHAFSPGHGKTVVGAYLVGSRGTPRQALFLGLTVTVTHTLGVFALGLVTLFAARYVLPEKLFPILSFFSGVMIVGIGLSLFVRRFSASLRRTSNNHADPLEEARSDFSRHTRDEFHKSDDTSAHSHGGFVHTHGGGSPHSHLPPDADGGGGGRVTWRALLALGISGGLIPCPSALVVMLSAIALKRVAFGLLLVVAFSVGLAGTLTAVGLVFLYAGRLIKGPTNFTVVTRVIPALSALVITCIGVAICYQAYRQACCL